MQGLESTSRTNSIHLRPHWGRMFAWSILLIFLGILAFALKHTQQGPIRIGQKAPDFTLTTFNSQQISLKNQSGKIVLVNFWASWCKPCEQEANQLEEAWKFYQPEGKVIFIGIAWTDTEANSKAYLQRFNVSYPNGPDLRTRISQAYRTTGVPETYIIDQNGKLAGVKLSPFLSVNEIRSQIDPLLQP